MENRKANRALLIGTITYAIGTFGTKFLNFLIVPLYTYYISPSDLGDYDLLVTTVSLLSSLITMKVSDATYRWIIKEKENEVPYISATYKLLFGNCLMAVLILLIINQFIPIWNCYYFIAILIGDRILECLQKILRGLKNQKLFAISGIVHSSIMLGLNVIKICFLHQGVTALLQSSIVSLYITILFIVIAEKGLRRVDLKPNYRKQQKEMLKYSIPLVPSALSWWVMSTSDRYIIRLFMGSAANGIYSVASKFPTILQTVFTMFNNAWTDMALAQLEKGNETTQYTKKIFEQLYSLSFGMAFVLIPLTKLFMKLILSQSYKEAAVYMGFLYMGSVFHGLSAFCSIGYLKGKRTGGAAITSIYGAIINLVVNILLIKYIGLFAASISTFLGYFVMWLCIMRDIRDTFPIKIDVLHFIIYLAIGIVISTVTIWTTNVADAIITVIAGVFFFIANQKMIKYILSMLLKKIRK